MRYRAWFFFCVICLSLAILSGCWSNIEINEMAFVMGIAVDQCEEEDSTDEYTVTVQIARPAILISEPGGGGATGEGGNPAYTNYTDHGIGIQVAFNKLARRIDRVLYTGHDQAIVISKAVAEKGIESILDFFIRSSDGRLSIALFIAEDNAREVLATGSDLEHLPVVNLKNIADGQLRNGEVIKAEIRDFLSATLSKTKAPMVPLVCIQEFEKDKKEIYLNGMAVFQGGALCTTLTPKQGQAVLLTQGRLQNGTIEIDRKDTYVHLNINNASAEIQPVFQGDQLENITVKLQIGCSVQDTNMDIDLLSPEILAELKDAAQAQVSHLLETTLEYTQAYSVDVFGFGELLYQYHPKKTEQLLENWQEEYPKLSVHFAVSVDILSSGSVLHPLGPWFTEEARY